MLPPAFASFSFLPEFVEQNRFLFARAARREQLRTPQPRSPQRLFQPPARALRPGRFPVECNRWKLTREQADIVVYLFDVVSEDVAFVASIRDELTMKGKKFLLVGNKVDAFSSDGAAATLFPQELLISARELRQATVDKATRWSATKSTTPSSKSPKIRSTSPIYPIARPVAARSRRSSATPVCGCAKRPSMPTTY